jgi:hypothetical protein
MGDIVRVMWTEEITWEVDMKIEEVMKITEASMDDIMAVSEEFADDAGIDELSIDHPWLVQLLMRARYSPDKYIRLEGETDHRINVFKEREQ